MPELAAPPAQTQDIGRTPTLLETLASQVDLTGAPTITGRNLPPIVQDEKPKKETKEEKPPEKPVAEKPKEEAGKKTKEEEEAQQQAEWKKASETVAEKLFKSRKPKEEKKTEEAPPDKKVEDKKTTDEPPAKPKEEKPTTRKPRISEAEITERAAAAAAEAATRAVTSKIGEKTQDDRPKTPDPLESLSASERRQFQVYQELESIQPEQYKGVTQKFLKSLTETQEYVKAWAKDNPGQKFDPDAEEHNAFFSRVEPQVDEDDWIDAKANLRAREMSSQAVKPLNEKLQQMERERARAMLEPFVQQKQLESVNQLLEEFDPAIAAEIRKPDGLKALQEKDPITVAILNQTTNMLAGIAAEVVRLCDPQAGVDFDAKNETHREIADFILSEEQRISKLPAEERMHEGKRFIGRLAYLKLPADERGGYWYLEADHVIYLLSRKYAATAKKIREAEIAKFNATAEKLGYKKIDAAKPGATEEKPKAKETPKPKETTPSPEAVSKTSVKTTVGAETKPQPSEADIIVGSMFHRLRS